MFLCEACECVVVSSVKAGACICIVLGVAPTSMNPDRNPIHVFLFVSV